MQSPRRTRPFVGWAGNERLPPRGANAGTASTVVLRHGAQSARRTCQYRPPTWSWYPSLRVVVTHSQPPRAEPPLVLVADDDRITREYVSGLLRGNGLRVENVASGEKAIDRVARGGVDLVLLDILMPGMDGIHCCRVLKSMSLEGFLPVVLLTGKTDTESRVEGLRIGADDYVCKPFDERELLARLHSMLRIKRAHDEVNRAKARLEQLAVSDELTGLYNYRYLHTRLSEEFKRAERYRDPLACAMVDIDHFKEFNDRYGHDVGDRVLAEVAERLRAGVREIDVVARYGGEEFLLVLPSTHFAGALAVADRVWRAVGESPFQIDGTPRQVTISVGVALYPSRDVTTKDQLLKAADKALYQAKADGRDRICVFQHQNYIYRP
jgi:two-component system, cell cycle response regulator